MNWYKSAQNNQEIMKNPIFKGFHCQRWESNNADRILLKDYEESYYIDIIDSIPFDLHDKMRQSGISIYPPTEDRYSEEYDTWIEQSEDFLYENGIRWIFVSHDKLFNNTRSMGASYGDNCYYILMPDNIILYELTDPHEENASAIIYDSRRGIPERIPIEENNELV
jgi:hypothetical protein